jgi:hypothetical protein
MFARHVREYIDGFSRWLLCEIIGKHNFVSSRETGTLLWYACTHCKREKVVVKNQSSDV